MLALVVALCAGQVLAVPSPEGPIFSSPALTGSGATFEFAPASGAGLPSAGLLCDQLTAAEKAGGWWCLGGDGASAAGGLSLPDVAGTVPSVQQTTRLCPNGIDCATGPENLFTGSNTAATTGRDGWKSSSGARPSGAFSVCAMVAIRPDPDAAFGYQNIVSFAETGASIEFLWQVNANATTVSLTLGGASRFTETLTAGAWHLMCMTSDASRGATSGRSFLDGVQTSGTYNTVGAAFGSQSWRVSGYGDGSFPMSSSSRFRGAFMVEAELSPSRIAALARAVLADVPTGSRGEAVNYSRTGIRFCPATDNTGSMLPANRPCVSRSAVRTDGMSDDLLVRRRELSNAAWADVGTPGVAVATGNAPDGTLTAWTLTDDNAAAFEGRSQVYATGSLGRYLGSLCLRAGTATSARLRLIGTGNAAGDVTATFTGLTSSWRCGWDISSPIKAVSPANYAAGLTAVTYEITVGDTVAVTGTIDVAFPQLEVAQSTALAAPTMFCDGAPAATAACGNDNLDRTGLPSPVGSACTAMTVQAQVDAWQGSASLLAPTLTDGAAGAAANGALYWWPYAAIAGAVAADSVGVASAGLASFNPAFASTGSGTHRFLQSHTGSAWRVCQNATCSTSGASTFGTPAFTRLKMDRVTAAAANHVAQWVSRVQYDSSNYLRCTP